MFRKLLIVSLALFFCAAQASATIVDADATQGRTDIGFGTILFGSGANAEYGLTDNLSMGIDYLSMSLLFASGISQIFGSGDDWYLDVYDLHLNYQVIEGTKENPFNLSFVAGYEWQVPKVNNKVDENVGAPIAGLCLSSPMFAENNRFRLNLVGLFAPEKGAMALPCGIEFGWGLTENIEVNLGFAGMGIIGIKASF